MKTGVFKNTGAILESQNHSKTEQWVHYMQLNSPAAKWRFRMIFLSYINIILKHNILICAPCNFYIKFCQMIANFNMGGLR